MCFNSHITVVMREVWEHCPHKYDFEKVVRVRDLDSQISPSFLYFSLSNAPPHLQCGLPTNCHPVPLGWLVLTSDYHVLVTSLQLTFLFLPHALPDTVLPPQLLFPAYAVLFKLVALIQTSFSAWNAFSCSFAHCANFFRGSNAIPQKLSSACQAVKPCACVHIALRTSLSYDVCYALIVCFSVFLSRKCGYLLGAS